MRARAERAAVIKHQQEARVVVHRRDEPAAAHFEARRGAHVDEFYRRPGIGVVRECLGEPLVLVGGREEAGITHAERRENALAQKCAQGLARYDLDDAADDVGGMAVMPGHARLLEERQLAISATSSALGRSRNNRASP